MPKQRERYLKSAFYNQSIVKVLSGWYEPLVIFYETCRIVIRLAT
jgi:hypothetical protein